MAARVRWGLVEENVFDPLAWRLYRAGVRPNHFTFAQVPVYAAQAWFGWHGALPWFAAAVVFGIALDGADGIMARRTGHVTPKGRLLDALFDLLGIGVVLLVTALLHPDLGRWSLLLGAANVLVYYQNEVRGEKTVAYTRGPVLVGLLLEPNYAGALGIGVGLPLAVAALILMGRLRTRAPGALDEAEGR